MAATILRAAELLGVEPVAPDGSERVSGHSLRATGAQGLAAAGVETWAIELLGRWGSDAVRGYVRDARLASASDMARRVAASEPLEELVRRLVAAASSTGSSGSGGAAVGVTASAAAAGHALGTATPPGAPAIDVSAPLMEAVRVSRAVAATDEGNPRLVANSESRVAHRVAVGPGDGPSALWVAACGWRFGLCPHADVNPAAGLPSDHRLLCQRCLPALRRARQEALAAAASAV